jgi:hypothetical protein
MRELLPFVVLALATAAMPGCPPAQDLHDDRRPTDDDDTGDDDSLGDDDTQGDDDTGDDDDTG